MTTPLPTPFPTTITRAGVFALFVIISDSDNEITTLPIRPLPPSPDHIPDLYGYPLDSGDDSSDEDLSETDESLHTQTASTLIDISMPLGYKSAMDGWRAASPSTCHPLLPSEIPSLSSLPSLLTSSSSPPPSLLPSSSRKRSRSPSPSLPSSVSPSPLPIAVPPPPKHIESVRDDIEARFWDLKETMSTTNQGMSFAEIKQIVA
ncbi:hypothetical protein Tco_0551406 [Tanacetum coccineum]